MSSLLPVPDMAQGAERLSDAAIRWLMWNMPYHAEHHAFPAIPFHALPALHTQCNPPSPHTATGYAAFHREAIRRSLQPGQPAKS